MILEHTVGHGFVDTQIVVLCGKENTKKLIIMGKLVI